MPVISTCCDVSLFQLGEKLSLLSIYDPRISSTVWRRLTSDFDASFFCFCFCPHRFRLWWCLVDGGTICDPQRGQVLTTGPVSLSKAMVKKKIIIIKFQVGGVESGRTSALLKITPHLFPIKVDQVKSDVKIRNKLRKTLQKGYSMYIQIFLKTGCIFTESDKKFRNSFLCFFFYTWRNFFSSTGAVCRPPCWCVRLPTGSVSAPGANTESSSGEPCLLLAAPSWPPGGAIAPKTTKKKNQKKHDTTSSAPHSQKEWG